MLVVPKLVQAVTQIRVATMFYHPQYFAVIAQSTQHYGFGSALPILPTRGNLPQFGNHCPMHTN